MTNSFYKPPRIEVDPDSLAHEKMTDTETVYPAKDLDEFSIVVTDRPSSIDFRCYQCEAFDQHGPLFKRKGRKEFSGLSELTASIEEAQIFLSGHIAWSGCSDLYFDEQESGSIHFCGIDHARTLARLIENLYEIAQAHIEDFTDVDSNERA